MDLVIHVEHHRAEPYSLEAFVDRLLMSQEDAAFADYRDDLKNFYAYRNMLIEKYRP